MLFYRSSIQTQLNRAAAVDLQCSLATVNLAAVRKRGHVGAFVDASFQVRSLVLVAVITSGVFV